MDESDSTRLWLKGNNRLKIQSGHDMSINCPSSNTIWLGSGYIKFVAGTTVDFTGATVNLGSTTATAVFG
jgi:hypothetical protein